MDKYEFLGQMRRFAPVLIFMALVVITVIIGTTLGSAQKKGEGKVYEAMVQVSEQAAEKAESSLCEKVDSSGSITYIRDRKTDVMYVIFQGGYRGGMSVMLDTDGSPLLYENWKNK